PTRRSSDLSCLSPGSRSGRSRPGRSWRSPWPRFSTNPGSCALSPPAVDLGNPGEILLAAPHPNPVAQGERLPFFEDVLLVKAKGRVDHPKGVVADEKLRRVPGVGWMVKHGDAHRLVGGVEPARKVKPGAALAHHVRPFLARGEHDAAVIHRTLHPEGEPAVTSVGPAVGRGRAKDKGSLVAVGRKLRDDGEEELVFT